MVQKNHRNQQPMYSLPTGQQRERTPGLAALQRIKASPTGS